MNPTMRSAGYLAAIVAIFALGMIAFGGHQGVPALMQRREEISKMQEINANLMKANDEKRRRIQSLQSNPGTVEVEMRNRLKLQRQNETSYIVPDPAEK